ncbi:MAG: (Fe-S)-binding protein [Ignavibacterium sp.]|nr:(Fe-S)-binding protein [Ignavibacterium sp.]
MNQIDKNLELLKILPHDDILQQCMHCGLCLATCPTYDLTKFERSSPRGRIYMIKSVARGQMEINETFAEEMNFCLDCQACETACPAGVKYGRMVETARIVVEKTIYKNKFSIKLKRFLLRYVVASREILKFVSRLLRFYQKSGLQKFLRKIGLLKIISKNLFEIEKLTPEISEKFSDISIKEVEFPNGEVKFKTAFHFGCLMNTMFADINQDTVDVLKYIGCKIITPREQVCCGSLLGHNGDMEYALKLARKNIDAFIKHDYDYLISNSAGCGAFMKDYAHLLEEDPEYSEKAKLFSSKVRDIMEFLSEQKIHLDFQSISYPKHKLELEPELELITYHDACHLAHAQKITSQPREIIKSLCGKNYIELDEASWCCGSAGIYNVVRYEDSLKQLERKIENIKRSGAKIVLTGNPGCIGQIKYGARKFDLNIQVLHPITFIKNYLVKSL